MKVKIACLKNACLEREFKTGDNFLPRRGAADLGQLRGNFFAVVRQIFCSGGVIFCCVGGMEDCKLGRNMV